MNIKIVGSLLMLMTSIFASSVVVDSPKRITREWESKVLGIQYGVTTLDNAVDEMVFGLIDEIFDKKFIGRIKSEIDKNRVGEGEYLEYWPNGNLKARLAYKDGKAHGHLHGWHENGHDAFKGYFHEGLKQGIHITFFDAESRENINIARLLTYTDQGKLHIKQYLMHRNRELWTAVSYKNGVAHGALEGWDPNGKPFLAAQYKKGVLLKRPPPAPIRRPREVRVEHKYVDQVLDEFIKIARKEFGVVPYGRGGSMPFDVETISVNFNCIKKGTVEEARELIVKLTEGLTLLMNKHKELRPYLREYPCKAERAHVYLNFCNKNGEMNEDGSICSVVVGRGNTIAYGTLEPGARAIKNNFREPYEEAVKIVHAKKK
jgi:hypothetical protein